MKFHILATLQNGGQKVRKSVPRLARSWCERTPRRNVMSLFEPRPWIARLRARILTETSSFSRYEAKNLDDDDDDSLGEVYFLSKEERRACLKRYRIVQRPTHLTYDRDAGESREHSRSGRCDGATRIVSCGFFARFAANASASSACVVHGVFLKHLARILTRRSISRQPKGSFVFLHRVLDLEGVVSPIPDVAFGVSAACVYTAFSIQRPLSSKRTPRWRIGLVSPPFFTVHVRRSGLRFPPAPGPRDHFDRTVHLAHHLLCFLMLVG